jgi:hypothetical protein
MAAGLPFSQESKSPTTPARRHKQPSEIQKV